jgi:TonB family protein
VLHLKRIGKYEIIRELGRGAMGVVFQARDPLIGRLVALKTITTVVAENPDLRERFYREAQAAGGLQHPNVVTIYEMGEAGAIPFIAMEYLQGESLEQLISRRTALPLAQKLGYIVQASRALDYAHRRGIVHRDIKPGNIMVTIQGVVKVVDFGIARLVDTSRTQTGTLLGTFGYMSPQQVRGKRADERSDIWAMGIVMYELLSYQRAFSADNHAALLLSILGDEPPPIDVVAPECSPELATVVHKALRKEDSERYQSMEALLLDLEPIWTSHQRVTLNQMLEESQRLISNGKLLEARAVLRQSLLIDASSFAAKSLLEDVTASLEKTPAASKLRECVARGDQLLAQGLLLEARQQAEEALAIDPQELAAQKLLERIELQEQHANQEEAEILSSSPAELVKEYVFESAGKPARVGQSQENHPGSRTLRTPLPPIRPTSRVGVGPGNSRVGVSAETARLPKSQPATSSHLPTVALPKAVRTPSWQKWLLFATVALLVLGLMVRESRRRANALRPTVTSAPVSAPAPPVVLTKPESLEDQQRHLIDLAHEAADTADYKTAQSRLDEAQKLGGSLSPLIEDLRKRFSEEEHNTDLQQIAKQERPLWDQAMNDMKANNLDQAERSFRAVLTLPGGGRRRADAQHYLNQVIPARRQEEQLWAQAQQLAQSADPARLRETVKILDQIVAAAGVHQQQAQLLRGPLLQRLAQHDAGAQSSAREGAAASLERSRFADLENQYRQAAEQANLPALDQLNSLRSQFRAIADAGGPLAANARNYSDNLIPTSTKQIQDRLAGASATAVAEAQFNDAVSLYNQAAAAKDSAALKARVLPEFERIAAGGGPRAAEAEHYSKSLIPAALRSLAPWPNIGCPASPAGLEARVQRGALVACGLLDSPKLQWAQFSWPEFPGRARQAGIQKGLAMLSITVDEGGNVIDAHPRSAPDVYGFTDSAATAARQWKMNPPVAQGKPVRTQFAVDIPFSQ